MSLATGHPIVPWVSLLLFIGQVACAARPPSVPGPYNSGWKGGSEQKKDNSKSRPPASAKSEAVLGEKAARTPAQQKISSRLLYALKMRRAGTNDSPGLMRRSSVKVDADGTTLVDIRARVTEAVLARIQGLGGTVVSSFPQYKAIRVRIPLLEIVALAEMPEIIFIRPADEAITN